MGKGKKFKVESSAGGVLHGINGQCLYMESFGILIGIDLSVLLDDHFVDKFSDPPVKFNLCLRERENSFPMGMKHFKLGKRLYLLGGAPYIAERSCCQGSSNKIFEFVPNLKYPEESIKDCDMPLLKAPKGLPLVVEIGDLICVIQAKSCWRHPSSPTFEVYDCNAKNWRGLDDAPEYVQRYYVVGDKLFVIGIRELVCYNFFSNRWTKADEAYRSFQVTPVEVPMRGIRLRGLQFGPDFHVMINMQHRKYEDEIVTYAMILNKNGLLLCYQEIDQIFSSIRMDMVESFFFDLGWEEGGNKRMCAVLIGHGYDVQSQESQQSRDSQLILCVSIFNLCKLDNGALADLADPPIPCDVLLTSLPTKTFLKVIVIRERVCLLDKHIPYPFIGDAFLF